MTYLTKITAIQVLQYCLNQLIACSNSSCGHVQDIGQFILSLRLKRFSGIIGAADLTIPLLHEEQC